MRCELNAFNGGFWWRTRHEAPLPPEPVNNLWFFMRKIYKAFKFTHSQELSMATSANNASRVQILGSISLLFKLEPFFDEFCDGFIMYRTESTSRI